MEVDDKSINAIYKSHYFKVPITLKSIMGLWQYEFGFRRKFRRGIMYLVIIMQIAPIINGCRIWCGVDMDICCENLLGFVYLFGIFLKILLTSLNEDKYKVILETIARNWLSLIDPEEKKIIQKYANLGKIKSVGYFFYVIFTGIVFASAPMFPVFLDFVKPLNESREKIMVIKAEYIIDHSENYYKIYIFMLTGVVHSVIVFSGIDGFYTIVIHQYLATLAVVKHRAQSAANELNVLKKRDYKILIEAIIMHKESIEFNQLINVTYSTMFLLLNSMTVIFLSIASIVTLRILDDFVIEADLFELVRVSMLEFGVLVHLFYFTWPGQMVFDLSEDLFISTYLSNWYNISKKGKELLKVLMLRLTKPSKLVAGGLYDMNYENYGAIVKTTLSYITVAVSFRG